MTASDKIPASKALLEAIKFANAIADSGPSMAQALKSAELAAEAPLFSLAPSLAPIPAQNAESPKSIEELRVLFGNNAGADNVAPLYSALATPLAQAASLKTGSNSGGPVADLQAKTLRVYSCTLLRGTEGAEAAESFPFKVGESVLAYSEEHAEAALREVGLLGKSDLVKSADLAWEASLLPGMPKLEAVTVWLQELVAIPGKVNYAALVWGALRSMGATPSQRDLDELYAPEALEKAVLVAAATVASVEVLFGTLYEKLPQGFAFVAEPRIFETADKRVQFGLKIPKSLKG